tara:strand:+ start:786 stop:1643 length:858 start_codon:yes stop_codon:yes gene_type:complete
MAQIRHVAIVVSDQERAADFYKNTIGLSEAGREYTEHGSGVYLCDGEINLALLNYQSDAMAGAKNSSQMIGTHHFGIQVEDLDDAGARIGKAGGEFHFDFGDEKKGNFERKFRDPSGVIFDVSKGGWIGTSTRDVTNEGAYTEPLIKETVPRIRHIALGVPHPEQSAEFYSEVFGFGYVGNTQSPLGDGVYLTDGYINLALLNYKTDEAAGVERGKDYVGTHHFGFHVNDLKAFGDAITQNGGEFFLDLPVDKESLFYERKYRDPDGIIFDISHNGWSTTKARAA